jgi:hypothetical protein
MPSAADIVRDCEWLATKDRNESESIAQADYVAAHAGQICIGCVVGAFSATR